jgi:hypothetical protein
MMHIQRKSMAMRLVLPWLLARSVISATWNSQADGPYVRDTSWMHSYSMNNYGIDGDASARLFSLSSSPSPGSRDVEALPDDYWTTGSEAAYGECLPVFWSSHSASTLSFFALDYSPEDMTDKPFSPPEGSLDQPFVIDDRGGRELAITTREISRNNQKDVAPNCVQIDQYIWEEDAHINANVAMEDENLYDEDEIFLESLGAIKCPRDASEFVGAVRRPAQCSQQKLPLDELGSFKGNLVCFALTLLDNVNAIGQDDVVLTARHHLRLLPMVRRALKPELQCVELTDQLESSLAGIDGGLAEIVDNLRCHDYVVGFYVPIEFIQQDALHLHCLFSFALNFGLVDLTLATDLLPSRALQAQGRRERRTYYVTGYYTSVSCRFLNGLYEALHELEASPRLVAAFATAYNFPMGLEGGALASALDGVLDRWQRGLPSLLLGHAEEHTYALVLDRDALFLANRGLMVLHPGALRYPIVAGTSSAALWVFLLVLLCMPSLEAVNENLGTSPLLGAPSVVFTQSEQLGMSCALLAAKSGLRILAESIMTYSHDWYRSVVLTAKLQEWWAMSRLFADAAIPSDVKATARRALVQAHLRMTSQEARALFPLPPDLQLDDFDLVREAPALLHGAHRLQNYARSKHSACSDDFCNDDTLRSPTKVAFKDFVSEGSFKSKTSRHQRIANLFDRKLSMHQSDSTMADIYLEQLRATYLTSPALVSTRHPYLVLFALAVKGRGVRAFWQPLSPPLQATLTYLVRHMPRYTPLDALLLHCRPDTPIDPVDFELLWEIQFVDGNHGSCSDSLMLFHPTMLDFTVNVLERVRFTRLSLQSILYMLYLVDVGVMNGTVPDERSAWALLFQWLPLAGWRGALAEALQQTNATVRAAWHLHVEPLLFACSSSNGDDAGERVHKRKGLDGVPASGAKPAPAYHGFYRFLHSLLSGRR